MDCFNWTELYILEMDDNLHPANHTTDTTLHKFKIGYSKVHIYLITVACLLGILSNLINVIVLTRPQMQSSLNLMLMSLATADVAKLSAYYITVVHDYSISEIKCMSHDWLTFLTVDYHLLYIFQASSILLTVLVAAVRYIFVCCLKWRIEPLSIKKAGLIIIGVVTWSIVSHIPIYLEYRVRRRGNTDCFIWGKTDFAISHPHLVDERYAVIVNSFIPCLLLVYFSIRIIWSIQKSKKRHQRVSFDRKVSIQTNRTTMMLVFIVLCAAVTEMPIGVTSVFSFVTDTVCELKYLQKLVDLLRAISSGVNIFFYMHMSQHYYNTFNGVFSWENTSCRWKNSCCKKTEYTATQLQRTTTI